MDFRCERRFMGLFDSVICNYPLPGTKPSWYSEGVSMFQTKSLDCTMSVYTISDMGVFSKKRYTGEIVFYNSNIQASGPGVYTARGEDLESVEYRAVFVNSQLTEVEQTEFTRRPALPITRLPMPTPLTNEQQERIEARHKEPLTGKRVYLLWGGQEKGTWVRVVFQGQHQLCVEYEVTKGMVRAGDLQVLDIYDRDRLFWDSEEEALSDKHLRQAVWDTYRQEYEEYTKRVKETP